MINRSRFPLYMGLLKVKLVVLAMAITACSVTKDASRQPNVLFIAVDDLRPELGCYGRNQIKSPNIDALAASGLIFENAYCNMPVCGASRASLLTGIRPTARRFATFNTYAQKDAPNAISLPEHFKQNGYYTVSLGKVFHHVNDMEESWSEPPWSPVSEAGTYNNYLTEKGIEIINSGVRRGLPYESAQVEEGAYFDGEIAERTVNALRRLKNRKEPFFLATGFIKPHLPFNAPRKYWDLYTRDSIHLPYNYFPPKNVPPGALHNFDELRGYYGVPKEGVLPDTLAIDLIHGYYACVSYVDALIGNILDELNRLDLSDNTIIVLWGDHGWQLGEHGLWSKHANFKTSLNAPLMIKAPGFKGNQRTRSLVEFIDIFPSLSELAGIGSLPQWQGKSFVPLMIDPDLPGSEAVYARHGQAESVKTKDYLYTEWLNEDGAIVQRMIYDHKEDPDENINKADDQDMQAVVAALSQKLLTLRNDASNRSDTTWTGPK